ncbi:MAG: NADH-quinone oxidoreductase subunit L [Chlorobiota bacterium]|nr:MAG: NADH-quinone oxidoreductase subunit L [Chlorobiota bacterium]
MIDLIYLTVLFPLLGFLFNGLIGPKIKSEKLIGIVGSGAIGLSFVVTVGAFFETLSLPAEQRLNIITLFQWIAVGGLNISFSYQVDQLSLVMSLIVTGVGFIIHVYSIGYMHGDKSFWRFFAYLNLFIFAMMNLVLADNFLLLFLGWEGVGLCSYLLIGFWYDRKFEKSTTSAAGLKAFIVNRIGDFGFLIGMFLIYSTFGTLVFSDVFARAVSFSVPEHIFVLIGIFLFIGATGKSAQIPLLVWLPDAMAGPTPVSALIHAATMVAAGVYLVVRVFGILTADAMLIIATIGALSAFIPATIALTQNDIKRVLAYSTVSQLGYMIMALGVGAYKFAFFHLITHAFFKACLFLGSGSVIHAMHHEQDIRNMGGLRKKMPITYATFLISSLAVSGIPLTSGFLSKDGILSGAFAFGDLTGHWLFVIVGLLVAMLTAFYMFRLVIITFHGEPRDQHKFDHAHESKFVMAMPLVVLSLLSLFFWYTPNPMSPDAGWFYSKWIKAPVIYTPENVRWDFMKSDEAALSNSSEEHEIMYSKTYYDALHHAHGTAVILSLLVAVAGILLAFSIYQWKKINADNLAERFKPLYKFSYNKWYFDELYHKTFIAGTLGLSWLVAWFDRVIVDGIVDGSATVTKVFSNFIGKFDNVVVDGLVNLMAWISAMIGLMFRKVQTGKVQTYIIMVIFSIVILLFLFKSF